MLSPVSEAESGRQHVSQKRRHRPANPHGAKTQDFNNNMIIIAVRTSNLITLTPVPIFYKSRVTKKGTELSGNH
jgi:hypothetical protein